MPIPGVRQIWVAEVAKRADNVVNGDDAKPFPNLPPLQNVQDVRKVLGQVMSDLIGRGLELAREFSSWCVAGILARRRKPVKPRTTASPRFITYVTRTLP